MESLGLATVNPEELFRVNFGFDYHEPFIDFDKDSFVSFSSKDTQYHKDGKVQTLKLGESDIVLRIYDTITEH
jgi:hypothetical protein